MGGRLPWTRPESKLCTSCLAPRRWTPACRPIWGVPARRFVPVLAHGIARAAHGLRRAARGPRRADVVLVVQHMASTLSVEAGRPVAVPAAWPMDRGEGVCPGLGRSRNCALVVSPPEGGRRRVVMFGGCQPVDSFLRWLMVSLVLLMFSAVLLVGPVVLTLYSSCNTWPPLCQSRPAGL